jgi:hypothetical protein
MDIEEKLELLKVIFEIQQIRVLGSSAKGTIDTIFD